MPEIKYTAVNKAAEQAAERLRAVSDIHFRESGV